MARSVPPQATPVVEPAAITVDLGELTFGDMLLLQGIEGETIQLTPALVGLLDRVVVGGIQHRKLSDMAAIMEAINSASQDMANAGN